MKKYALLLAVFFFLAPHAHAAIAVDTTVKNQVNASANIYTLGSVVVNNANSVIVVFYDNVSGSGDNVTSPAFNGTAMTLATKLNNTGQGSFMYVYYLANPTTGTHSFTAHTGGATDAGSARAFVLTGVDQTNPVDNAGTVVTASGATGSLTITPTFSNGVMLSENFADAAPTVTAGTNVTTLYPGYFSAQQQGSSVGSAMTGGVAFTQTYGVSPSNVSNITGVILKAIAAAPSTPPNIPFLSVFWGWW